MQKNCNNAKEADNLFDEDGYAKIRSPIQPAVGRLFRMSCRAKQGAAHQSIKETHEA
ncbi:MAG: hypothetical protein HC942_19370 [Microcoleus sp. SU_5_6]|nr:hypothetical protein [Microcoleus sp. SU_5_6]NJL68970.1 hypothetical protein [Microcoleus sp. SM1_3_4]